MTKQEKYHRSVSEMPEHPDLIRLKKEYQRRAQQAEIADRYSYFSPSYLFTIQHRQAALLELLRDAGYDRLVAYKILEVGCGSGGVMLETLSFGAMSENLWGVDILFDRLQFARRRVSSLQLACADGQRLPFWNDQFDLTMQFTVFSSILDDRIRQNVATEMMRVTKPGGAIVWYDFFTNPMNRQTRGIRSGEIKALFPDCNYRIRKVTLAPPITQRVVKYSRTLCTFLERIKLLNFHYLALIRPKR